VCYEVQNSLLWNAGKKRSKKRSKNTAPFFPPAEREKKQKILDLTKRGKFDNIAHSSITVFEFLQYTVADDWSQLLGWAGHHPEPEQLHPDIQERHVDNVEEWLIQTSEFRKWCGSGGEV